MKAIRHVILAVLILPGLLLGSSPAAAKSFTQMS